MMGLVFRIMLKAFVPLTIVFGAMFYMMYLNGQNPLAVFTGMGDRILAVFSSAGESVSNLPDKVGTAVEGESRTFYKWQDVDGSWHYGEDPPANARSLTAITLRLTDNVVPAFKDPDTVDADDPDDGGGDDKTKKTGNSEDENPVFESPYSPEQIKELFEDTRQLQETINLRQQQLDGIGGGQDG